MCINALSQNNPCACAEHLFDELRGIAMKHVAFEKHAVITSISFDDVSHEVLLKNKIKMQGD
jgi:hypothetical protein